MRISIFIFFFGCLTNLFAQDLIVVNGGVFGTSEYANISLQNISSGSTISMDTIYTTSVQDILIDGNFAYLAAQDSIIKYDLSTRKRVAACSFGAVSTIKLAVYNDKLLVGNWYAPFGFSGNYTNHLRVFDTNDLSFIDSVPEIDKPATDILIKGDYAYVVQNNSMISSWGDTLGYLAVVDLTNFSLVRRDTLSMNGDEIGRLVTEGDMIYSLNSASNTISLLNTVSLVKSTVAAAVDLKLNSYGPAAYLKSGKWYLPFDNGIGSYDLNTNSIVDSNIVQLNGSFAFTMDTINNQFCVSQIDYLNQTNNKGTYFNMNGDSTGSFSVGYSPELITISNVFFNSITQTEINSDYFSCYPNPATEFICLNMQNDGYRKVIISDISGRLVFSEILFDSFRQIKIDNLDNGVYFIQLSDDKGRTHINKFIKQ